jgi:hypothetical protein
MFNYKRVKYNFNETEHIGEYLDLGRDEIAGGKIKIYEEEFHKFCSLPDIKMMMIMLMSMG